MKKAMKIASLLSLVLILTACNLGMRSSYTFNVETGDEIKVTLKNVDDYTISQENGTFVVSKDDQKISQGAFITEDAFKKYKTTIEENQDNLISNKESGEKNDNEYIYYETEGSSGMEYNYIVFVNGSSTGVIIGSTVSKEEAQNVFKNLSITYDIYGV